ncbi:hypothetical protein LEQ41_00260 [Streptococcus agalactiae]|nr:hypothetical protein [Streptococcus agalactiae]
MITESVAAIFESKSSAFTVTAAVPRVTPLTRTADNILFFIFIKLLLYDKTLNILPKNSRNYITSLLHLYLKSTISK